MHLETGKERQVKGKGREEKRIKEKELQYGGKQSEGQINRGLIMRQIKRERQVNRRVEGWVERYTVRKRYTDSERKQEERERDAKI